MGWFKKSKTTADITSRPSASPRPDLAPRAGGVRGSAPRRRLWRALGTSLVSVLVALPLCMIIGYIHLRGQVLESANRLSAVGAGDLPAWTQFASLVGKNRGADFFADISRALPLLASAGDSYKAIRTFTASAATIAESVLFLEEKGFALALHDGGPELLTRLATIRDALGELYEASALIPPVGPGAEDFLALRVEIGTGREFLAALHAWLDAPQERHLAVLFENSSELRPGGGFLGSYAELTLRQGSVKNLIVRDINEPDRLLMQKTVPPLQLQKIVRNWRAADANWFFHFPASAAQTLDMLDTSELYRASSTRFDAAIAVTPEFIRELLIRTGPLTLPSGEVLAADTFLRSIQAEVQAGQAARESAPKKILAELAPLLIEKLAGLAGEVRGEILAVAAEAATKKDLRFYFRDAKLQTFIQRFGADGGILPSAANANGGYLAVVNANIGGGKSDAVMEQAMRWENQLTAEGLIRSRVTVRRTHGAGPKEEWWYRVPNTNFLQVFAPAAAKLTAARGGASERITSRPEYRSGAYATDPDVAAIEATRAELPGQPELQIYQQSDKRVFATWTSAVPGETTETVLEYEYRAQAPPHAGLAYEFAFEKQAASRGAYHIEISAPVGFLFAETDSPIFVYESADPPGRLIFTLTLREVSG